MNVHSHNICLRFITYNVSAVTQQPYLSIKMTKIDASLFAHIQNDANLSGTYGLQGNFFSNTIGYLKQYLDCMSSQGELFPAEYNHLLQDMDYLLEIEKKLYNPSLPVDKLIDTLGKQITADITSLSVGQKIHLPGGWKDQEGGHAMIYQFTRTVDGYLFTAINAGAGIEYHHKKSSRKKELYNPVKAWHFPTPNSAKEKAELAAFIGQILRPQLPIAHQKRAITEKVLYQRILPRISYIGGKEVEYLIPEYGYTGGQLSGTCSERCLHQMLKILSPSEAFYERFIFKFKHHALFDYAKACLAGEQPFTPEAREQINLAIENNLKILDIPGLFQELEKDKYYQEIKELQKEINRDELTSSKTVPVSADPPPQLSLLSRTYTFARPHFDSPSYNVGPSLQIDLCSGKNLIDNLATSIGEIEKVKSRSAQYYYLEKLILELPLDLTSTFYDELKRDAGYVKFEQHLDKIQNLLWKLQSEWLKEAQTPTLNHLALNIIALQTDVKSTLAKEQNLPSFSPFTEVMMQTVIGNNQRNPYWATNNPILDKRFQTLQKRYRSASNKDHHDFYSYLKAILATEPELTAELKRRYESKYGLNITQLHKDVRAYGLEALFMISQHLKYIERLEPRFNPVIQKIQDHINYESKLREAINPFFAKRFSKNPRIELDIVFNEFRVSTPLYPTFVYWQELSTELSQNKYVLKDSPAQLALNADVSEFSTYRKKLGVRTANNIQLAPTKPLSDTNSTIPVTPEDITTRDYFHLRSVPSLQIPLTLDYFTRHIDKLANESDQRYVEANIFQPGLLAKSLKKPSFLPQFDIFLTTGFRFFNKNGEYTRESLLFLRLDYLVSRYIALMDKLTGLPRLQATQEQLLKQLSQPNHPDITYVQQQYLFLTLMARIELGEDPKDLFALAFDAYFYIRSHANPNILEDLSHQVEVDRAIARFQMLANEQPEKVITHAIRDSFEKYPYTKDLTLIGGKFPVYRLEDNKGQKVEINVYLGKLFEKRLARSGVPFSIQKHPLIKHLGLEKNYECLSTADEKYMYLPSERKEDEVHLFYDNDDLTIQKNWRIGGQTNTFELLPLTQDHLAAHANKRSIPLEPSLPKVLTDDTVDYWQHIASREAILTQNGAPLYAFKSGKFIVLDKDGNETAYTLKQLHPNWCTILNRFESNHFIIAHSSPIDTHIKLPRYGLEFKIDTSSAKPGLVYPKTGEKVVEGPSPIHPSVAGLVLENDRQTRYLVPVARFYATNDHARKGDFYPVIHDTNGTIANESLKVEWSIRPPARIPLWNYQNSERAISFRLQDGEPLPDSVADALYLAYIYLATNQTTKAWKVLEDCNTRLGGLTGDPAELQFISWICKDLPHILPNGEKKAKRNTPRYVACQLKAISLLSDYLLQDRKFNLTPPNSADTANSHYQQLEHQQLTQFLNSLPTTIYHSFQRMQTMKRHLEHDYQLSLIERKRLLDYYQNAQPKNDAPKGALGYEWMSINLEFLQRERQALKARSESGSISNTDKKRLEFIENYLREMKPVLAKSTALELVPIDLSLPDKCEIKEQNKPKTENWFNSLPGKKQLDPHIEEGAMSVLVSDIKEDEFITHFPTYFHIACTSSHAHRKQLLDFCAHTLIAARHVPLDKQESDIPFLCNVLYRLANDSHVVTTEEVKFNEVVNTLKGYSPPLLQVYQARDVYKDILATPDAILDQEHPAHTPLSVTAQLNPTLLIQTNLEQTLGENREGELLKRLVKSYRALEDQTSQEIEELGKTLTFDLEQRFDVEIQAGKKLFAQEKGQKALAQTFISDPDFTRLILETARSFSSSLVRQEQEAWSEALNFANQGPESPEKAKSWKIKKRAKSHAKLSKADLLSIYCSADTAYSIEKTGLSPERVQELHNLIHKALFASIQNQLTNKVISHLDKTLETKNIDDALQAFDLLAREEIPGLDETATVIIQYEENILLRKRQVSALKRLLTPLADGRTNESVEKIIPGGGKSKVVIPVLAEKKANGNNLVVVEVPPALLPTNHVDLNRISQRLYGKRAYRFEFNRDSNCSPERLEQLYQHFTEIMTTRCYLVTTGESIQSLELKYLELLLSDDQHDEVWQKQVYWLDKITGLFRNQADCIIDEAHQGLWIKKKLNYTVGEPKPIGPDLIKNGVALFSFIDTEFIKQAPYLDANYDWDEFKRNLATKLIKEANSPLKEFVAKAIHSHGEAIEEKLIAYLLDKEMCEAVALATTEEKDALSVFKQEINTILPETLRQKLNVKYGASRRKNLSPVQYTLPIPYSGNNAPNESSRDGNELVALNRGIQMMLIKGISEDHFKERLIAWQIQARQELFLNPSLKHLDDTPTARGFALLEGSSGLTLSQVNVTDAAQMERLYNRHKNNRFLIFSLLQEASLKQISLDPAIISSDSFNHVDVYHSVQCVTGSPSNHMTYHHRLNYDATSSLGSDGYILEILDSKNTSISSLDYQGVYAFIESAITNSSERARTRAIIDINATFTGVSNYTVAKEIARYAREHESYFSRPIKHILYLNEEDVLCALDINKPEEPIKLGTSDEKEIRRILGSTPNERISYYDQFHTLGTDLEQAEDAHALALVDENNLFQEYIQGDMRMRWISRGHTLEMIVPKRLDGISRPELTKRLVLNEKTMLLADVLSSGTSQLINHMRRNSLTLVQDLPSEAADHKSMLAKKFRCFFEEKAKRDYFALYGSITEEQDVAAMFELSKKELLTLLTDCYESAGIPLPEEKFKAIDLELQSIINKILPWCPKRYKGAGVSQNKEVQVQVHKDIRIERAQLNACYNPKLKEEPEKSWGASGGTFFRMIRNKTRSLNDLCSIEAFPLFSDTLRASKNYTNTYINQAEFLNVFLKPVFLVWYHYEGEALYATIVTPQELKDLEVSIGHLPGNWIATTQDTVVAGTRPEEALRDQQYFNLREQVRFFNGEFQSLLNQDAPLHWLKDRPMEKITFFENTLQAYRPGSEVELPPLKTALAQANTEGFVYITQHPFDDLTNFDWKSLYPKTIPAQSAEYKKVAEAFVYLNQNWLDREPAIEEIQERFSLPLSSLGYIDDHLKHLSELKQLLEYLSQGMCRPLDEALGKCLEKCLGLSLESFCHGNRISELNRKPADTEETKLRQLAALKALRILQNYPALKGKSLKAYFTQIARDADSTEVLHELLTVENLSQEFFLTFIRNPFCNHEIVEELLNLNYDYSERVLTLLAMRCGTKELIYKYIDRLLQKEEINYNLLCNTLPRYPGYPSYNNEIVRKFLDSSHDLSEQTLEILASLCVRQCAEHTQKDLIDKFLQKKNLSDYILCILLEREDLDETQLLTILAKASIPDTLERLYQHRAAGNRVQEVLWQHAQCSSKLLLKLLDQGLLKDETLLKILTRRDDISASLLRRIVSEPCSPQLLLAAVSHRNANSGVIGLACENEAFSCDVALQIFNWVKLNPHSIDVVQKLIRTAFDLYQAKPSEWKSFLLQLLEYCKDQNTGISEIMQILHEQELDPGLAIEILRLFGKDVLPLLPMEKILRNAEAKDLDLLVDYKKTRGLNARLLPLLADKCSTPALIEKLLDRRDLTAEVLMKVLVKHPHLDPKLLLKLLSHPNTDTQVIEVAFENRAFSPQIAIQLVGENRLIGDSQEIILDHHRLFKRLVRFCFAKSELINNSSWQEALLHIFKQYEQIPSSLNDASESIIKLIEPQKIDGRFGLEILRIFGQNSISVLPMEEIIETAQESDIKLLINSIGMIQRPSKKTQDSERLLMMLVLKCSTSELINRLLDRQDLTPGILSQIIVNNPDLTPPLLLKLISHPGITPEVIVIAFNHKSFSSEIAQTTVENNQLFYEKRRLSSERHNLLKNLVKVCFAKQALMTQNTEWQRLLLSIFRQYKDLSLTVPITREVDSIIEIIREERISEDFGLEVFRIFGKSAISALPIENIIKIAKENDLELFLDNIDELPIHTMPVLAQRCLSGASIIKFLQRKDLSESMLLEAISGKGNLIPEIFSAVMFHPKATPRVVKPVMAHPEFSCEIAEKIVSKTRLDSNKNHALLKELLNQCFTQMERSQDSKWEFLIIQILQKYSSGTTAFNDVIDIVRAHRLNASLGIKLLYQLGRAVIDVLPLKEMIAIADDDGLSLIYNTIKFENIPQELLVLLIKKAQSPELFNSILKKDISWDVIETILNRIPDYYTLRRALTHENASEDDCQNWLQNLTDKQKALKEEASRTEDVTKRLLTALNALKVKACSHALAAVQDKKYEEVASTSIWLYRKLEEEITQYLKTPNDPGGFLEKCTRSINESRGILETHRGGAKQLLVDIVSAILAFITVKFIRSASHKWDFFETKTASIKIVEELKGNIQDLVDESGQRLNQLDSDPYPNNSTSAKMAKKDDLPAKNKYDRNRIFYKEPQENTKTTRRAVQLFPS